MSLYRCKNTNCQFEDFLNLQIDNDKYFTLTDDKDCKCIFHSKEKQCSDKEDFLYILKDYIGSNLQNNNKVSFKDVKFYNFEIDTNTEYEELSFTNVEFHCYPNFDNLKCKSLIIDDCSFYQGGRFKGIFIDEMVFKVKLLERALVFSTGGYAKDGLIVEDETYLKNIKSFSNHVDGSGKIFFVGMNFENANFKNAMLEQVVFQNCNLSKVKFLNSDINNTEFRNCIFPKIKDRKSLNEFNTDSTFMFTYVLPIALILSIFILLDIVKNNFSLFMVAVILLLLSTLFFGTMTN